MDVEVLGGVVVVHIDRHLEIDAADGVHQFHKTLQVHSHIVVHRDAQQIGQLLAQPLHAAHVVGSIEFWNIPVGVDQGVPGDAHGVDLPLVRVHHHQDVGVAAAVVVVMAGHQDGKAVFPALADRLLVGT